MRRIVSKNLTQLATALALLGAVSTLASSARAQDDVTLSMARERFKEGVTYFDKKDFAKARVAFLQAYALKKHPAVLLNLAQSELRSGHEADAAQHFSQYLREHKEASESERQSAETGLNAAKALVAEVTLDVDVSGAELSVDGEVLGSSPLPGPIFLAPGSHRLVARKEAKTTSSDVSLAAGQKTRLGVKLAAAPNDAPVPPPRGEVSSPPPPESDNGGATEPAPEPESHQTRKPFVRWVASTPGAIVGVGLTGAGLIGGAAFSFGSKAAYDAADSVADKIADTAILDGKPERRGACVDPEGWLAKTEFYDGSSAKEVSDRQKRAGEYQRNCSKYQDNVKSGDRFKTLAIVSFAVAGAAAVGTIVYYFVDSKESDGQARRSPRRRVTVLPIYQPGFAGGLISGTF
jgi:hypothetical protein